MYIRPVLFGTGPQVGVNPANQYEFIVFVMPVGPYFKDGFKATPCCIMRGYDRAAPLGTGRVKVGGNYAASLTSGPLSESITLRPIRSYSVSFPTADSIAPIPVV